MFLIPQQQILKGSKSEFQMGSAQMQRETCKGREYTRELPVLPRRAEGMSPGRP